MGRDDIGDTIKGRKRGIIGRVNVRIRFRIRVSGKRSIIRYIIWENWKEIRKIGGRSIKDLNGTERIHNW